MTTTPDADVRAALDAAAGLPDLRLDPALVLDRGHRVVRRRRVLGGALGAAAATVVAVVAVQLGTGQTRALPPASHHTGAPAALSGSVTTGSDPNGTADAPSVRVSVTPVDARRVEETWTIVVGGTPVKTVRRVVRAVEVGQASLLLPSQSGWPRLLAGYVDTGRRNTLWATPETTTQFPAAPTSTDRIGVAGATLTGGTGTVEAFAQTATTPIPDDVVGVTWSEVDPARPLLPQARAIALRPLPAGTFAVVLRAPDGQQWLSWTTRDRIGIGPHGQPGGKPSAGALQLYPAPTNDGPEKLSDLLFGWVGGAAAPEVRSTDPADAWTVSDAVVDGRRAFLLTSRRPHFTGVLTVTAAGTSRSVDFTQERRAMSARTTDPGSTTTATP